MYSKWLNRQKDGYIDALLHVTYTGDAVEQVAALQGLMEFVRGQKLGVFDNELFAKAIKNVLTKRGISVEVIAAVIEKYSAYADVHYFLCRSLKTLCALHGPSRYQNNEDSEYQAVKDKHDDAEAKKGEENSPSDFVRNVCDILMNITETVNEFDENPPSWCGALEVGILAMPNDGTTKRQRKKIRQELDRPRGNAATVRGKWASRKYRQRALSDAWLELLKLNLPFDLYRSILSRLHDLIIPALINPLLLSDFLTHALDREGLDGMLALNGIFILVTQHGLEYPKFYERLYGLLKPEAFLSKHRVRFFQLADIFLASSMVPAYTAASFAKRFARLGMRGSTAAAIISIAFIHNILRRHPACMQIIHRRLSPSQSDGDSSAAPSKQGPVWKGKDVYDENEEDPAESRALESSLWELTALRQHADPFVAQYSAVLDKDLSDKRKTAEVDISEALNASYASKFSLEIKKRMKAVPTAVYAASDIPTKLFPPDDFASKFPGFVINE